MKLFFSISLCLIFSLFTSLPTFAQSNFQGVAYYQSKTTFDLDKYGGNKLSETQKQMIMTQLKSAFEKEYTLVFNKTESIFTEEEQLSAPNQNNRAMMFMSNFAGGAIYKNVKEKQFVQEQEFFGKRFLITDSLPDLEWKITGETKKIGQYLCMKATAVQKLEDLDVRNMRPKKEGDSIKNQTENTDHKKEVFEGAEMPTEIAITAWYTPQIPINQGPNKYYGLPGLILELNAGKTTFLCSKIVLNPSEKTEIEKPTKGEKVTQKEYNEIMIEKVNEMREMYGNPKR